MHRAKNCKRNPKHECRQTTSLYCFDLWKKTPVIGTVNSKPKRMSFAHFHVSSVYRIDLSNNFMLKFICTCVEPSWQPVKHKVWGKMKNCSSVTQNKHRQKTTTNASHCSHRAVATVVAISCSSLFSFVTWEFLISKTCYQEAQILTLLGIRSLRRMLSEKHRSKLGWDVVQNAEEKCNMLLGRGRRYERRRRSETEDRATSLPNSIVLLRGSIDVFLSWLWWDCANSRPLNAWGNPGRPQTSQAVVEFKPSTFRLLTESW